MNPVRDWPEPIIRVQSLSDSYLHSIPERYIKPLSDRPSTLDSNTSENINIPIIDLGGLSGGDTPPETIISQVSEACRKWGFFQIVNHGVESELIDHVRKTWRDFFYMPMEVKQSYANSPMTYEGYGSRLGVEKGAILDWSDYFFLHYLPCSLKDPNKWPAHPSSLRELVDEYNKKLVKLGGILMKILSINLGLREDYLQNAFGGEDIGACLRINFYPKCPQPDMTLGLSSHSDPGGMTILLPDDRVNGLQVRKDDTWITVKPLDHAFIVNIGDQIQFLEGIDEACAHGVMHVLMACDQVLSNANYKSVEHRVTVNSDKERLSLAFFYNPKSDLLIEPAKELVTQEKPALYSPMTYNEYRLFIRLKGPRGKSQVESLKSPR